ncbi:SPW repeat domain-containing protein [Pseudonocardia halophobica]|uniref:SPW repeat domain-containing protein n=1 Tax=Pseudonocardia halophobica TaxID=29401 RepID=UPI003D920438
MTERSTIGGSARKARLHGLAHDLRARSVAVVLIGAWLALSPLVLPLAGPVALWSQVGVGVALVALGGIRTARPLQTAALGLVNAALGVWVIVSSFAFHLQESAPRVWVNNFFLGCVVVLLAVSGAATCSFAGTVLPTRRPRHTHW